MLASNDSPSGHAWIAFHRCVEAYARLTGEPFCVVFDRLARAHGFSRRRKAPAPSQLKAAVEQLQAERRAYLDRQAELVAARRAAKARGQRHQRSPLDEQEARRRAYVEAVPQVGFWGWRRLRDQDFGDDELRVPGLRLTWGRGWAFLHLPSSPGDHLTRDSVAQLRACLPERLPANRLVVLATPGQLARWADDPEVLRRPLRDLGRVTWGRRAIWVRGEPPVEVPEELAEVLRATGWTVRARP